MADTAEADEDYRIVSTAVDQAFYRAVYSDLNRADIDPIRHYLEHGWREGRDPAPWFSVRGYLERYPDIRDRGDEPLIHYLRHGGPEGREISPSEHAAAYLRAGGPPRWTYDPGAATPAPEPEPADSGGPRPFTEYERTLVEPEFDAGFYFETNPFLAEEGVDPLEHFLSWGWREGRDPNPDFSVRDYVREYPDIAEAGVNPFAHYLESGRAEGRRRRSSLGFRFKVIVEQTPLEARIAEAAARSHGVEPEPASSFAAAAARSRTGLDRLHITFSHDDFVSVLGGVQLCVQYESAKIAEMGRDHLHICPTTTWPVLRRGESSNLLAVLNGEPIGVFSAVTIAEGLASLRKGRSGAASFAIHNLLGHNVDEVIAIVQGAGMKAGFFWLHDFTSLCAGYQLLRNDVQDCAAPPPDSAACGICLYGRARGPQVADHERLFRRLRLTVVSPSQTTLDFWRSRSRCRAAAEVVQPHVRLLPRGPAPRPEPGPLRVAFLGMPAVAKGWPIFAELAEKHAGDPRYRFLHLGGRRDPRSRIEFHRVAVSRADPRAMQDAVERLQVDVALMSSIVRETFCLAAYEAVAGGAAVVTLPDSANAASFVASTGFGRVIEDEAALAQALQSGELAELARAARRPQLYDLAYSGMTGDLLSAGRAP
jgi:hypothetical protein